MADIKVSALTELATGADPADTIYILDGGTVGVGGTDKKITIQNLFNSIPNLTELATGAASSDEVMVSDAGVAKRLSIQNLFNSLENLTVLSATPDSADEVAISDAGTVKKISVDNLLGATKKGTINFVIDGGGSAITTGVKGYIQVDFAGTIDSATLLADQTGSIVVDIWKDTYANYPPVDADSITASAQPTISSANKAQDSTLTGWTTSFSAGDILAFNVDSATTVERVTVALEISRTV